MSQARTRPPSLELYSGEPALGIVRGQVRGALSIEAVSRAFEESPPHRGDFLLMERDRTHALVARVTAARAGGTFAEGREAGASYLFELLRADRVDAEARVPEEVREMLHRLHIDLCVLGEIGVEGTRFTFQAGHRDLDPFGLRLRRPSAEALQFLASAGQQKENGVVQFGVMSRGHEQFDEVPVYFSIDRLKARRSFVFARAGYGKSNLVKLLLSKLFNADAGTGLLILDPEGEYAFEQGTGDRKTPGLADHPALRARLDVYTGRRDPDLKMRYGDVIRGDLRLDLRECEPGEILASFVAAEKLEQVWANYIRSAAKYNREGEITSTQQWTKLIELLHDRLYAASDEEIAQTLFGHSRPPSAKDKETGGNVSLQAIRNNLVPLIRRVHHPERKFVSAVVDSLRNGRIVVLDLSLSSHQDARSVANLILFRVFREQQRALTDKGRNDRGVVAVFEEAQTVLSPREPDTSIFVRWVKEGRKYGLGALMITQQPGSIAENIVAQGDNFFVMHLLAQTDLELLARLNAHYTQDVLDFIRNEPVRGNCYFWSAPDQPYVVPCKVEEYRSVDGGAKSARTEAATKERAPAREVDDVARALLQVIALDPRIFLVPVESIDGKPAADLLAISRDYTTRGVAAELAERGSAETVAEGDQVEKHLTALGILARSGTFKGAFKSREYGWFLLDRRALLDRCYSLELQPKALSPSSLKLRS
ncbi:MAG: DUF87 domain-containing protein [Planctomycetes bacterium]|nr:DUF87 domain-containing protein [Planctomycetota bacterium]